MLLFKLAFRSLARRRGRMLLIGSLVALGTVLLVFGGTFAASARTGSRQAIINYFTGDFVVYSDRSEAIPSPLAFQTPLPVIENVAEVQNWLEAQPEVETFASYSQNYGLVQVKKGDKSYELPFIFYAVDPPRYKATFDNVPMRQGSFFQDESGASVPGIVIAEAQNQRYLERYGVTLSPGDQVTLLSLTAGGSVNAVPSQVRGIFDAKYYKNVFDYLNYMDMDTYAQLYNFTGVSAESIPEAFSQAMSATSDEDIFALAENDDLFLDTSLLEEEELTGYTMMAVRLKDHDRIDEFTTRLEAQGWPVKTAPWNKASDFFAGVADILQSVILGATGLIFLITAFILMNTQIVGILERTGEIGTLRAIGAEKGFVMNLFLWESVILNGTAALAGMGLSALLIALLSSTGVGLPEVMSQYLVGGGPLKLEFTPWPFVTGFLLVVALSVLATLYPTRVAASVSPLSAMSGR